MVPVKGWVALTGHNPFFPTFNGLVNVFMIPPDTSRACVMNDGWYCCKKIVRFGQLYIQVYSPFNAVSYTVLYLDGEARLIYIQHFHID